jgi:hypothetical protein
VGGAGSVVHACKTASYRGWAGVRRVLGKRFVAQEGSLDVVYLSAEVGLHGAWVCIMV